MYTSPQRQHGFTLIELLVVIAIIGLLSGVLLASMNTARKKGRDARRLQDLRALSVALEQYYDGNGQYPSTGSAWWGACSNWGSHGRSGATGWIPDLAPTFITELPLDPNPLGTAYCYIYRSNGQDFMLMAYGTVQILRPSRQSDAAAGEPEYAQLRDLFIGRSNMVSIRDLSERINPHGIASKIAGGGSVIDLVMAIEGCNVATALQRLKIRAGDTMSP